MIYQTRPKSNPDLIVEHESGRMLAWIKEIKDEANVLMFYVIDNDNWDKDFCSHLRIKDNEVFYRHQLDGDFNSWDLEGQFDDDPKIPGITIVNTFKEYIRKIVDEELL